MSGSDRVAQQWPEARTTGSAMQTTFLHHSLRTRVVAKRGAVRELGNELAKLGCRRPMLLSSHRTSMSQLHADVCGTREFDFTEVNDIPQHSSIPTVRKVALLARENSVDALVAVGGGSVSGTAKAPALIVVEGEPLEQHASRFIPPGIVITPGVVNVKLPIIIIPMAASGAEVTPSLSIRTPEGAKLLFRDAQLASRVILLDPVVNRAMSAAVMLSTGIKGLAHCIEGLYSMGRSPTSSVLVLDGTVQNDRAMRNVAGSPTPCGAFQFAIFATDELVPAARDLGLAGTPGNETEALVSWIHSLQEIIGVPSRLRDLGSDRGGLRAVAIKTSHERGLAHNPRAVLDPAEIESILLAT